MEKLIVTMPELAGLLNQPCCRKMVGEYRSLSLWYGENDDASGKQPGEPGGKWRIGTYTSAWRLVSDGKILCGSMSLVDSNAELDELVQAVAIGSPIGIEMVSPFDIRVTFDNDIHVDFICVSDDDDQMFHVFGPNGFSASYSVFDKWKIRASK